MEVSMIVNSQVKIVGRSVNCVNEMQFCNPNLKNQGFCRTRILSLPRSVMNCSISMAGCVLKASAMNSIISAQMETVNRSSSSSSSRKSKSIDGGRLYVALPLDLISECNTLKHIKAITVGLKALKLMGIDGVELPVWWGIVERDAGGYNWSAYLGLVELIHSMGLKIHVSFHFHASKDAKIPLPDFVSRIGESNPDIFFTDGSGQQYKECLSLSVDDLPLLDGRTPVQAYEDFCESFKSTFASYLDSTVSGITMGLGPNGDLCYPSHHAAVNGNGVGELQCYDKNMLLNLKEHAESTGNPMWGLGGPHDAPTYNEAPTARTFFKDQAGSWETAYGDFFLSWYSSQLVSHGDRLLSMASSVFSDTEVAVSGKIPLKHNFCSTRSHPCELTSGFYNTANRDGYEAVAQMFAKNSASLVLPGMELLDEHQPQGSNSRPESLIVQIKEACGNNGVHIIGQNSSMASAAEETKQIKKNLTEEDGVVDQFIYQRMGAEFFSPKKFPLFIELVRSLSQPETLSDDLPAAHTSLNLYAQTA